jgi:hypothetical protein
MYLNGSSSHAGLTIVWPGIGVGIGAVGVSTVGVAGVNWGDSTRMVECTEMSECTGMASGMVEPTRMVEDQAEMTELS